MKRSNWISAYDCAYKKSLLSDIIVNKEIKCKNVFLKNNSPNQLLKNYYQLLMKDEKINKAIIYKESKSKKKLGNFLLI